MQYQYRKSNFYMPSRDKKISVKADLRNIAIVQNISIISQCKNTLPINPSFGSVTSSDNQSYSNSSNSIRQETHGTILSSLPSLVRMPQRDFLQKSVFKSNEAYRQCISSSIIKLTFVKLQICRIQKMNNHPQIRYELLMAQVKKGETIINNMPKFRSIFYQHSMTLKTILKYQIEDIFKNDPNSIYRTQHSNVGSIVSEGQQIKTEGVNMYFRQFNMAFTVDWFAQIKNKIRYEYIQSMINYLRPNDNVDKFDEDSLNKISTIRKSVFVRQNDQTKNSYYIIRFDSIKREYNNTFISKNYSVKQSKQSVKYPGELIMKLNEMIHTYYYQKQNVQIVYSLKQNYLLILPIIVTIVIAFLSFIIIQNKFMKYMIMVGLIVMQIVGLIIANYRIVLQTEEDLRNNINLQIQNTSCQGFYCEFYNEISYDLKVYYFQ